MSPDLTRLENLLELLRNLELRIPQPHERPILEVARRALAEEIRQESRRLQVNLWQRPIRYVMAS
ncbi:MAG: hypothetical protein FJ265_09115 [Planctomycetes bacterium]|nr:hypothetical protein [Planctomycetota bacterium]